MAILMKVRISFHTCVLLILLSMIQFSYATDPTVPTTETPQLINNKSETSPGTQTATSNPQTPTKTVTIISTSPSPNGNTNNTLTTSLGDNSTVAQTVTSVTATVASDTNKTNATKPASTANTPTTLETANANSSVTDQLKVTTTANPTTVNQSGSEGTTPKSSLSTLNVTVSNQSKPTTPMTNDSGVIPTQGTTTTRNDGTVTKTTQTPVNPTNGTAATVDNTNGTTTPVDTTNRTATPEDMTNKTTTPVGSTESIVTSSPDNKTTVENTSTQPVTTVTVSSTGNPSPAPTANPSPVTPKGQVVYINEIMVNKQGIFQKIEIRIPNEVNISRYAIAMVDGSTYKTLSVIYLLNFTQGSSGILDVPIFASYLSSEGVGIAIYDITIIEKFNDDWIATDTGVIDALVIGKTYDGVSDKLVKILTPGENPFVLDPSKYGIEKSISRCSAESVRSTEMFAYINPSMGQDNFKQCTKKDHFKNTLSIKISMQCGNLELGNNTINKTLLHEVIKSLVKDVNKRCQCGITRMHVVDPHIKCCEWTSLDMKFVAPNKTQVDESLHSFRAFIDQTAKFNVDGQSYNLDQSCLNDCCAPVETPLSKKDNSKNVKVTVAVIVTLLVLFLIIVFVIYMYMRRKKMAVQQFRMSRLEEDEEDYEDMTVGMTTDDHDEFVGGQEATFDLKA